MFIAKYGDLITEIADTESELMQKLICRKYDAIEETEENYVYCGNAIMTEAEAQQKEKEEKLAKKSKLKMTKQDFFLYVIHPLGITYAQLMDAIKSNDLLFGCYEGCNHIYRLDPNFMGNIKPMLETMLGKELDADELETMLDEAFEKHNAEN